MLWMLSGALAASAGGSLVRPVCSTEGSEHIVRLVSCWRRRACCCLRVVRVVHVVLGRLPQAEVRVDTQRCVLLLPPSKWYAWQGTGIHGGL